MKFIHAQLPKESISVTTLNKYPAPVLISDFINEFNFKSLQKSYFFITFKVAIAKTVTLQTKTKLLCQVR